MRDEVLRLIHKLTSPAMYKKFNNLTQEQKSIALASAARHMDCCLKAGVSAKRDAINEIIQLAEKSEAAYELGARSGLPLPNKAETSIGVIHRTTPIEARPRGHNVVLAAQNYIGSGNHYI